MMIMWNGRKYAAMAIAALAAAIGVAAAASSQHGNNGYAGVYSSDGAPAFGGSLEDIGGYGAAAAPARPGAHPGQRRREPKRLE
jgi:hypothetical protein